MRLAKRKICLESPTRRRAWERRAARLRSSSSRTNEGHANIPNTHIAPRAIMVKRGDMFHVFWSSRSHVRTIRYPLLLGIGSGFVIQTIWGIFPVFFCMVLLAAADEEDCSLAAPRLPFFGFLAGAAIAAYTFNWCGTRLHTVRPAVGTDRPRYLHLYLSQAWGRTAAQLGTGLRSPPERPFDYCSRCTNVWLQVRTVGDLLQRGQPDHCRPVPHQQSMTAG